MDHVLTSDNLVREFYFLNFFVVRILREGVVVKAGPLKKNFLKTLFYFCPQSMIIHVLLKRFYDPVKLCYRLESRSFFSWFVAILAKHMALLVQKFRS